MTPVCNLGGGECSFPSFLLCLFWVVNLIILTFEDFVVIDDGRLRSTDAEYWNCCNVAIYELYVRFEVPHLSYLGVRRSNILFICVV